MAQKKTSGSGQTSQSGGEKKKFGRRGDGLGTGPVGQGPRGDAKKPSGKDQDKGILTDLLTGGSSSGSSSSSNSGNLAGNVIGNLLGGGSSGSSNSGSSGLGNAAGNLLGGLLGGSSGSSGSSHSSGSSNSGGQSILSGLFGGGLDASDSSGSSGSTHTISSGSSNSSGKSKFNFKTILIIVGVIILGVFLWKRCAPSAPAVSGNTGTAVAGNALTSVLGNLGVSNMLGGSGTGSYGLTLDDATANTTSSSSWGSDNNTGSLVEDTVKEARAKYTKIKGNGKDTVTLPSLPSWLHAR